MATDDQEQSEHEDVSASGDDTSTSESVDGEQQTAASDDAEEAPETPAEPARRGSSMGTLLGFLIALGIGFYIGPKVLGFMFGTGQDAGPWGGYEDLTRYKVELAGHEPQEGPDDALVTIIEFSDYECPYCQRAHEPLMEALEDHDDVRLIFKHMPLPMHKNAIPAARAAWAAQQQGKFWEMHDHLFEVGGKVDDIDDVAEGLGLDVEKFRADMVGEAAGKALEADRYAAGLLGIGSTPHFVINGRHRAGAMAPNHWEAAIEHARSEALEMVESGTPRAEVYGAMMADAKGRRARPPSGPDPKKRHAVHVGEGRPSLGPDDAPITVVEFSDFQCPYCAKLAPTVHALPGRHADVRVVFRQMPLQNHPMARPAAKAALAAHRQGKFWEMHDALFGVEGRLDEDDIEALAEGLGLDMERFAADWKDPAIEQLVAEDEALARQVGVRGTPASFVNGYYLSGAQPAERFDELIAREREAAQTLIDQGTPAGEVLDRLVREQEQGS